MNCLFCQHPLDIIPASPLRDRGSCSKCITQYWLHSKKLPYAPCCGQERLHRYWFSHRDYRALFYPNLLRGPIFHVELDMTVILSLNYLPQITPSDSQYWLERFSNLKAFL